MGASKTPTKTRVESGFFTFIYQHLALGRSTRNTQVSCVARMAARSGGVCMGVQGFAILGLMFGLCFSGQALSAPMQISVDTSALAGSSAKLAFELIDGDFAINNSATISGFAETGANLGAATTLGGVSGSLPGSVVIDDTDFFNLLEQEITLGDSFSFILDVTSNFDPMGSFPDSFSFFLLDAAGIPIDTDILSDALLTVDFDGSSMGVLTVASVTPGVSLRVVTQQVPEPGTLWLIVPVMLFFFLKRLTRFLQLGSCAF